MKYLAPLDTNNPPKEDGAWLSPSIHKFDDVFIYSIRLELMAEGGTKCCPRRARPSRVSNRKIMLIRIRYSICESKHLVFKN